ncbi:DUF4179 domain-containing protein [Paenibacillus rigui]|nr:DUF4179 domain-containing protein [Paenibacillus rigui]
MKPQEKQKQMTTPLFNDEDQLIYPDFEAMWERIEPHVPDSNEQLLPVAHPPVPGRRHAWRTAFIAAAAVLVLATPVFAAISYNWDAFLFKNGGIRAAYNQGLGQSVEKSLAWNGVKLTVHTAVVDDNRMALLFSVSAPRMKSGGLAQFGEMSLRTVDGQNVEGRQRLMWDGDNNVWRGTFEAQWTPETTEADVQFLAQNLRLYSAAERQLAFQPSNSEMQSFDINQDGIQRIAIQPFVQGDKVMLVSHVFFSDPSVQTWPAIGIYKGNSPVSEAAHGFYGKPGEQGEYTVQQFFKMGDLADSSLAYKLLYTKKDQEADNEWSLDLHLNKEQMKSGTQAHELDVPIESGAGKMTLKQMIVTPTQVRLRAFHEKNQPLIFKKHHLEINGREIPNGNTYQPQGPEETDFYFDVPPDVRITEHTPIALVMNYEVVEHKDNKTPIVLKDISKERKTLTTQVGGYSVQWTYYSQDGSLYVQSESADPRFGGVNQTYMLRGGESIPGRPVTTNFTGDGNNQNLDEYKDYQDTSAEIYMYSYFTDNPEKGLRVELNK